MYRDILDPVEVGIKRERDCSARVLLKRVFYTAPGTARRLRYIAQGLRNDKDL